jgi:hypothetical protein
MASSRAVARGHPQTADSGGRLPGQQRQPVLATGPRRSYPSASLSRYPEMLLPDPLQFDSADPSKRCTNYTPNDKKKLSVSFRLSIRRNSNRNQMVSRASSNRAS